MRVHLSKRQARGTRGAIPDSKTGPFVEPQRCPPLWPVRRFLPGPLSGAVLGFVLGPVFGLVMVLALTGCDDDDAPYTPVDTTPPTVNSVDPPPGTKNVGLHGPIRVSFSEAMSTSSYSPSTISAGSFGPAKVSGAKVPEERAPREGVQQTMQEMIPLEFMSSVDGDTLTIVPDSLFLPEREWTLTIDGVTDLAGNAAETFVTTFETGPFEPQYLADWMEPNDGLTLGTLLLADVRYPSLSTCEEDTDFYKVTLIDTLKLTATTTIAHAAGEQWEMSWSRSDGSLYATHVSNVRSGDTASLHYSFLPGLYYLQIHSPDFEEMILYDLEIESSEPCSDDPYEDNDFQDEAYELEHDGLHTGLTGCYLDADWFKIDVLEGHHITIVADMRGYMGTRRLEILEPGGDSAVLQTDGESTSQLDLEATDFGTAYFMVMTWSDGIDYDLGVALDR